MKKILSAILLSCMFISTSAQETAVSLTQDGNDWYVNMPKSGTSTLTLDGSIKTFKVYDDGGKDGNYSNKCRGTLVVTAPEGYGIQLSGNIITDYDDYLTVFDNNEGTGERLISYFGSSRENVLTNIPTVLSSGQSITLYFYSGSSVNYAGLDLTVIIFDANEEFAITTPDATTGGSISAKIGDTEVASAKPRNIVTLTATPSNGYFLSDLTVTDAENNIVPITWDIWSNTATFTMPLSAVSVTPTFSNNLTADGGLYINIPATGTQTVTIPENVTSFKVYDDGGKDGNYSNKCRGTLVVTAPEGYGIQLSGNIITDYNDYLTVFDNNEATGKWLISGFSSSSDNVLTNIPTVLSSGQSITLYFYSNSSVNYAGLDLTVIIFDANEEFAITTPDATTGGSISAKIGGTEVSAAKPRNIVTLTATPSNGYFLSNLTVTDAENNIVPITWDIWSNTATFTMPLSAVTVTPTFSNNLTADDGLYINMPVDDWLEVSIPENVTSFKVYDDGGKDGNYSNRCNGTLVLTAPEGYGIQLSGNIITEIWDELTVYDNNEATGERLIGYFTSSSDNVLTNIPTVLSSGQSIWLYFYSNSSVNYAGLDLTVIIFDANEEFAITTPDATAYGSISAKIGDTEVSSAKPRNIVTLTATPSNGYLLSDLTVTDADNNIVPITWNGWHNTTATFTMPPSAVTVTPTFTNNPTADGGLYVNIPASGTQTVTIPENVTSFKVYDDGGKDGNYSNSCDGTLVLTAPEGYAIRFSGNFTTEEGKDKLTVYDNNVASGSKLLDEVSGTMADIVKMSSDRSITLNFKSNDYTQYAGIDFTATLISPNTLYDITKTPATGGSISAKIGDNETISAKYNDVITITATPESNYLLSGIDVIDEYGKAVPVSWYGWPFPATYVMPRSNVTVTPTFTNNLTADGGLFINMPATGTQSVTIPDNVTSFKVYDDGGKGNKYSKNCNGTLILSTQKNCYLQLSGSMRVGNGIKLTVYDNDEASGDKLVDLSVGKSDITALSTGRSMTLNFTSNNSNTNDGLDFTVTFVDPNQEFAIITPSTTGGTVTAKKGNTEVSSAKVNDVITLTVTPDYGYDFSTISIVDANGKTIYSGNSTTFRMPVSDVTITPTFIDNRSAITKNDATGGSITTKIGETEVTSALHDEVVTITATPEDDYILSGLSVKDKNGRTVPVDWAGWYSGNFATFTMPSVPVAISPVFSQQKTAEDGLFINMPTTGTLTATIPALVKSFKIYDDGGQNATYSAKCNGTLIIAAPENCKLELTLVHYTATEKALLTIYDNNEASGPYKVQKRGGTINDEITGCQFSSGYMTLNFTDPNWEKWSGLKGVDLIVTCIKPLDHSDITVEDIPDQEWTGSEITPTVTVTDGANTLTLGTDYTVEYSKNTNTGTATATITGIGNYCGTIEKSFAICFTPANFSQDGGTYIIHTAKGWNMFCEALQDNDTYNRFIGKTVKLDADITVARMAGSENHDFCGIFDGQGHTITIDGTPDNGCSSLFQYVTSSKADPNDQNDTPVEIKNLHVTGTIFAYNKNASGLISKKWGIVTIENCRVSVIIKSEMDGDGTHAGFVASNSGQLNIIGCVFDGKMLSIGENATTYCGGFVGWNSGATNFTNSLYAPAAIGSDETEVSLGPDDRYQSATFVRNGATNTTITNCYYTRTLGDAQGKQARIITAGDNVELALSGSSTVYNVSGITAYSNGIKYDNKLFASDGDEVSISHTDRNGYEFKNYSASGTTLSGSTLTIPDKDVTITANWTKNLTASNVADIPDQTWTGSAITPTVVVTDGETTLTQDNDYTVEYSNNTNTGTAKATITGQGNYSGKVEKTFEIVPKETTLGALSLSEDQNGYSAKINGNYTGTETFSLAQDIEVNSVSFSRTFTANQYSTIILPFDVPNAANCGLFYSFDGVKHQGDAWIAQVTPVTEIKANTPYLFKPSTATPDLTKYVDKLVATTSIIPENDKWDFVGMYQYKEWAADADKDYGFAGEEDGDIQIGEFVKVGAGASINPFRCYLTYKGTNNDLSKSAVELPDRIIVRVTDPDAIDDNANGEVVTPVSSISENTGVKVWSYNGTIFISAQTSMEYQIVDMGGRTIRHGVTASNREEVSLNGIHGIVIVKIGNQTFKLHM